MRVGGGICVSDGEIFVFKLDLSKICDLRQLSDESIYYIYAHYRPGDDVPFYIGKGKEGRAWMEESRSRWWKNIVNKYGRFEVGFLYEGINEWDAYCLEIFLIWTYGRRDRGVGPLVNMTDGGEGLSGMIRPEISELMKGNTYGKGNKGSVHNATTRQKNSDGHKGLPSPMKGKKLTEAQIQTSSIAHLGLKFYCNDELKICRQFRPEMVPDGWYIGTKYKKKAPPISEATRHRQKDAHKNQKHSAHQDRLNSERLKKLGKDNPIFGPNVIRKSRKGISTGYKWYSNDTLQESRMLKPESITAEWILGRKYRPNNP